jgi:hypothetical protein
MKPQTFLLKEMETETEEYILDRSSDSQFWDEVETRGYRHGLLHDDMVREGCLKPSDQYEFEQFVLSEKPKKSELSDRDYLNEKIRSHPKEYDLIFSFSELRYIGRTDRYIRDQIKMNLKLMNHFEDYYEDRQIVIIYQNESLSEYCRRIETIIWIDKCTNLPRQFASWSTSSAISFISMLDTNEKYAILPQSSPYHDLEITDLNHDALQDVQGLGKHKKWKYAPIEIQWEKVMGMTCPVGLEGQEPGSCKLKLYKQLCGLIDLDPFIGDDKAGGLRDCLWNLSSFFKSLEEIKKLINLKSPCRQLELRLHDLSQFKIPLNCNRDFWRGFLLKNASNYQKIFKYVSQWGQYEDKYPSLPTGINEYSKNMTLLSFYYEPEDKEIAMASIMGNMSRWDYREYLQWFKQRTMKTHESIPRVKIEGKDIEVAGMILEQLPAHSPMAPLAGLYTNCCQHPNGMAHDCSRSAIEDDRSAIWVIWYKTSIIAQTFVWRKDENLILDSIEAIGDCYVEGIAKLFLEGLKKAKNRLGIEKGFLGCTDYGITKEVTRIWDDKDLLDHAIPLVFQSPSRYTDAHRIREIKI